VNSPTQRSLKHLREAGWTVCIVEKWIEAAQKRVDAFGFGDLLACKPPFVDKDEHINGPQIVLVQTTTMAHMAARKAKIYQNQQAAIWNKAGGKIILHGWAKRGPRGKRKLWQVKEEIL